MYELNDSLAVYALKGTCNITDTEMRYCNQETGILDGFKIVDVRMISNGNNSEAEYKLNIERVLSWLRIGDKVVVCCETGKSKSNAIALAVLVKYFKLDFEDGLRLIKEKVPNSHIHPSMISDMKELLDVQCTIINLEL
jgi:hypothetical protein